MWIQRGCTGPAIAFNDVGMRSGFDPTTLTWLDVQNDFLPKRLKSDPGAVKLEFSTTTPRSVRITCRAGKKWTFRVEQVALECADITARECTVKCTDAPLLDGASACIKMNDELTLTAALLTVAYDGTLFELGPYVWGLSQYKNAHWDDAAMTPPVAPAVLLVPPMPDWHPQLVLH